MKRGEVWWVSFDQGVGGEMQKRRPAVILSNNLANQHANRVQVVPLSTRIDKLYPCETLVVVKDRKCKAIADQLTTVSKQRMVSHFTSLTFDELAQVEMIVRLQLAL